MAPMLSRLSASLFMLSVAGCTGRVDLPAAGGVDFEPIAFFSGRTHGDGELKKLLSNPVRVTVDSVGSVKGDTLILDQTIRENGKVPSVRRWTMRRVGHNRYSGTLTDAVGAVEVDVAGPRASIRYTMKHGVRVAQQLVQQSDGSTVLNRLVVQKFGVRLATLNEIIRKSD
ncbi:MAG TPA: DUF3833 family protein [Sphingomicrobium sp.]|nr:DUF3833 family protein [Sphingomicrobium sp.]